MPATLTLPIRDEDSALTQAVFGSGKEDQYRLRVTSPSGVLFYGPVLTDLSRASLGHFDHSAALKAICGLGRLQGPPYTTIIGDPWPVGSRALLITVLAELLALTGLDLDIYTAFGLYPHASPALSGDPLGQIEIDRGVYTKTTTDGTLVAPDAYDVLSRICQERGLTAFQQDGAWHLVHRYEKTKATHALYHYDSAGLLQSASSPDPVVFSWADRKEAPFIKGSERESLPGLASASYRYDHGEEGGSLLTNGSFEKWNSPTEAQEWTRIADVDADAEFFRGTPALDGAFAGGIRCSVAPFDIPNPETFATRYFEWTGPTLAVGSVLTLRVRASALLRLIDPAGNPIADTSKPRPAFLEIKVGTNYAERTSGVASWSGSQANILLAGVGVIADSYTEDFIDITTPASGGEIRLRLSCAVETEQLTGETYDTEILWDGVSVELASDDEDTGTTAIVFSATLAGTDATEIADEVESKTGDGRSTLTPGRQTIGASNGTWRRPKKSPSS